jgi:hypothetical protein
VRVNIGGITFSQQLTVMLDPRVSTTQQALQRQFDASMRCYNWLIALHDRSVHIDTLLSQIRRNLLSPAAASATTGLQKLADRLGSLKGFGPVADVDLAYSSVTSSPAALDSITGVQTRLVYLLKLLQSADCEPTQQAMAGIESQKESIAMLDSRWDEIRKGILEQTNAELKRARLTPLTAE